MLDFEVKRCTRQCAVSERELKPGESFFSALVPEGADVVRRDYSEEAWQGPPENAIGWWKSQLPHPHAHKLHWAPNDVLLHYFEELAERPGLQDSRYVLALLLVRKRILRFREPDASVSAAGTASEASPGPAAPADPAAASAPGAPAAPADPADPAAPADPVSGGSGQWLHLVAGKSGQAYDVPVCEPTEARVAEIQQELAQLLFADAQ